MKGGRLDVDMNGYYSDDRKVYWRVIYALSITKHVLSDDPVDENKIFHFRLNLTGETSSTTTTAGGIQAIEYNGKKGDLTFVNGEATFTLRNGETKTADLLPLGFGYKDEEIFLHDADRKHFKTTAENWNGTVVQNTVIEGEMNDAAHYTYAVVFSNLHAICKITDEQGRLLYAYNSEKNTYLPAFGAVNAIRFASFRATDTSIAVSRLAVIASPIEMMVKELIRDSKRGELTDKSYMNALHALPKPLQRMFVHAYQSYLFNEAVSKRVDMGINRYVEGDIVIDSEEHIVRDKSPEEIQELIDNFEASPTCPLFGTKVPFAGGEVGEMEENILKNYGITKEDFEVPKMPRLGSHGLRRSMRFQVWDASATPTDDGVMCEFSINKGSYATAVLREVMKKDVV